MTTATGLLINVAAAEGNLEAYDAKTGELLAAFSVASPRAGIGGLSSSYEIDGEQSIADDRQEQRGGNDAE